MLSVCCAVILLHHILLLLHGPHIERRNTEIQKHEMQSRYCTALYFCFTALISVGFGNVAPNTDAEKLYAIVMMLLGCEWQANSHVLMFWVGSRINFLEFTLDVVNPSSTCNPPPIGFHCRYSSLLTSTQLNISFETSPMNDVATFDISQNILADQTYWGNSRPP